MENIQFRAVPFSEIASCPSKRLDPEHYLPTHRTWECKHGDKLRTKGALVKAWLNGKITTDQFFLAMKYVR